LIVDGYHFKSNYLRNLQSENLFLLFIDDEANRDFYPVNGIVNQNLYFSREDYVDKVPNNTQLFVGAEYVLLRREFLQTSPATRNSDPLTILITFGGGNPNNVFQFVLEILQNRFNSSALHYLIVLDSENPSADQIKDLASKLSAEILEDVANMPEVMARSDFAITGAGSTIWEMLYLGVPVLAIELAENQHHIAQVVEKYNVGFNLGTFTNLDKNTLKTRINRLISDNDLRRRFSKTAQTLIDGNGTKRLCNHLVSSTE
jgi:spore coat polysaccharide biosynthesis predicted glycosyltransferase SpsG